MKRLIYIFGFLLSQNSFALRISIPGVVEIKAEDPQIIKDASRGVQKLGAEVANGIRDVSSAVGNATGVSGVLEHNSETIQHAGRLSACAVTFCYSEYNRKKELEQQESEQKQQLESELNSYKSNLESSTAADKQKSLKQAQRTNTELQKGYEERLAILENEFEATATLADVLKGEKVYRQRMQQIGLLPEQTPDGQAASLQFEQNLDAGFTIALMKLEPEVQRIAIATGRSHERIRANIFHLMSSPVIEKLEVGVQLRLAEILKEKADLQANIQLCIARSAQTIVSSTSGT